VIRLPNPSILSVTCCTSSQPCVCSHARLSDLLRSCSHSPHNHPPNSATAVCADDGLPDWQFEFPSSLHFLDGSVPVLNGSDPLLYLLCPISRPLCCSPRQPCVLPSRSCPSLTRTSLALRLYTESLQPTGPVDNKTAGGIITEIWTIISSASQNCHL
jgi:hypothetical protein